MADPFTLGGLALGPLLNIGGGVARGIATGVAGQAQADAMFSDEDRLRLAELQRRAEADALGLTGAERDAITNNLLQPQQAAMRSRDAQYAQLLGAGGTSQAAFNQLRNLEQAEQAQAAQAARDVELLNQQEARRQQAELQQLDRQRIAQQSARTAAIAQTLGGIVGGGFDVFAENLAKSEKDFALDQTDLEALGFDNQQQLLGALRYLQRFGFQGGTGGQ